MHDGVSRSACPSEASCAEDSDHAWTPGQLYWAEVFSLGSTRFFFDCKKEMGGMLMDSHS